MAIISDTARKKVGSEYDSTTDGEAAFVRTEPLLTPDLLKRRFLFGIPLVSALPDPITKKRAEMTPDDLRDIIARATCQAEEEVGAGFHITPVEVTRRLPFDRAEYKSLGFIRLPDAPIVAVTSLQVKTADSTPVYTVPLQWIDPGGFRKGQVNVIPLMPAFIGQGGTLPSFDAGGAAWLSLLGSAGWVASYWEMTYITGFEGGHIPLVVNELVGVIAALDVLQLLAATNRVGSYSLNLDAAGQSVQTGGPNIYDGPIEKLELRKKTLIGKLKARFYKKIAIDNI